MAGTNSRRPTRERILDEAQRLIARRGVYGFTLNDIATPLDVKVPAIYKHFKSRDDVLVELSRRFIDALSRQFDYPASALRNPTRALRRVVEQFVDFHLQHPAYVRLSLVDFATPAGGMEYIRLAAGGAFRDNLSAGPLAPMHRRLRSLIVAGRRTHEFRAMTELSFYRVVKSALLICLVFPDDLLIRLPIPAAAARNVKAQIWDVARRYLTDQAK